MKFPALLAILSACLATHGMARSPLVTAAVEKVLAEASMTTPEQADFRAALLASTEWQHEFLDSGPLPKPAEAMALLHALWKSDPALAADPIDRGMATACALAGADRGWDAARVGERYVYFRDAWDQGLLNSMFGGLSVFQRRYLANGVQHDRFNTLESMHYQLEEVCLPADQYPGACWYARWILNNPFGDSIHGPHYYEPFQASWGSDAEMVRHVGGVCGSLSNFGAAAAIANGIPAATMGEPGHCAYVVMISPGQWVPSYSLSWDRGLHYGFHGGSWSWHVLNTRAHEDVAAARKSGDLRRAATALADAGETGKAVDAFRRARRSHPLDYSNWLASAAFLASPRVPDQAWQDLHRDALELLAPEFPEVAWTFLKSAVYPKILPSGEEQASKRRDALLAFHRALKGWGVERWKFGEALREQMGMVSADATKQDEFALACFGIHATAATLVPPVLEAQFAACGQDEVRKRAFIHQLTEGLAKGRGHDFDETIGLLAARILPESAAAGDRATFQFLGKLASRGYEPCAVEVEKFPGILLSSGGCLSIAAPGNQWDVPSRHWGVIENHGGDFHTDSAPAFATVQLGNFGRLSGVVIVQRDGNIGRLAGAKLQTSADGSTWTDVHVFENPQRVERIDLRDRKIDAGYVRVLQENGPHLHFNRFLVFGAKQN
ncbi:MAG: discoidin domain-containing protein [Akkermansiaceae bacterium]|jgi:hypothetical protein|nr:discoidin domain-containing protein [Akkermansiaceae bacterium]